LGKGRVDLDGDGGYKRHAREERESWDGLAAAQGEWLISDARSWYGRLCNGPAIGDLKVAKVKMYFAAVLHRLDTLQ